MRKLPSQQNDQKIQKFRSYGYIIFVAFAFISASIAFFLITKSKSHDEVTAIFFTCCKRYSHLNKTLQSFFTYNNYPLKAIILANDGQNNPQLQSITSQYKNMTVMHTNKKVGQIMTIDIAFGQVKTQYVFYSEDNWRFYRQGLIDMNIQYLKQDPKLLQVWNRYHGGPLEECGKVKVSWEWAGFSFDPSVLRISDWKQIKGGFAQLTQNSSYGAEAGSSQVQIIKYFQHKGFYIREAALEYILHF